MDNMTENICLGDLFEKLQSGQRVTCPSCKKGILVSVSEDEEKTPGYVCSECNEFLHIYKKMIW